MSYCTDNESSIHVHCIYMYTVAIHQDTKDVTEPELHLHQTPESMYSEVDRG